MLSEQDVEFGRCGFINGAGQAQQRGVGWIGEQRIIGNELPDPRCSLGQRMGAGQVLEHPFESRSGIQVRYIEHLQAQVAGHVQATTGRRRSLAAEVIHAQTFENRAVAFPKRLRLPLPVARIVENALT
jgi:hypothetical protein